MAAKFAVGLAAAAAASGANAGHANRPWYIYDASDEFIRGFRDTPDLSKEEDYDSMFHMGVQRCAHALFRGTRMPSMEGIDEREVTGEEYMERLNVSPKEHQMKKSVSFVGCLKTRVFREEKTGNFLSRSEFAIKNGRVGMVLWTAVRGRLITKGDGISAAHKYVVKANNRMIFLNPQKRGWRVMAGYSWDAGTKDGNVEAGEVKFTFPDRGSVTLRAGERKALDVGYGGLVRGRAGKEDVLRWDLKNVGPKSGSIEILPQTIRGLRDEADAVYYPEGSGSGRGWKWTRLKRGGTHIRAKVGDAWTEWSDPFVVDGRWRTLESHCPASLKRLGAAGGRRLSGNVCFMRVG